MNVAGKVALVTGGASGIGKAIVELLLQKHVKCAAIIDVNENALKRVTDEFGKKYGAGKVSTHNCDVSSLQQMDACFKNVKSSFGDLHIVCNQAGIHNEINWRRMLEINVNGVVIGTQLAVQYMNEGGVIINTSSRTVLTLAPLCPMYVTSKSAVLAFTKNVAVFDPDVIKKKLRVNAVCPPYVATAMTSGIVVESHIKKILKDFNAGRRGLLPQDVADHLLQLIEEPHHGQAMYIKDTNEAEMLQDECKIRRQEAGLDELFIKTTNAAIQQ